MVPKIYTIKKIIDETPTVKSFILDRELDMQPGQFFMVWLPGIDEKPFVLSYFGRTPGITIRKHGRTTKKFHSLQKGDKIGLRGPFGKGFTLHKEKKAAIVAGGIGMIAMAKLAEAMPKAMIISGARTKDELIFDKRFKMQICTDDGSAGEKMFSPDLFKKLHEKEKFEFVYTCGPEIMMKAMLDICRKLKVPMEASLERYMKCGVGVCASCVCGSNLVCKEGPVFSDKQLLKMDDFGNSALLMSGKKVSLKEYAGWSQE